jgi:hypothetical protein
MKVILGPVPCQGCRRLVFWGGRDGRRPLAKYLWRDVKTCRRHLCEGK